MKITIFLAFLFWGCYCFGQTTYTSISDGDWEDCNTWGTCVGSFPGRDDHVIINHNVTVNDVADNGSAGVSPDGLSLANVGAFPNSGTSMFYQTGDITINSAGSLTVTGVSFITEGQTEVDGTLSTTNDFVSIDVLNFNSTATVTIGDDLILSGLNQTNISNGSVTADDIYLDWTDAILCGSGSLTVTDAVQEFNGADVDQQICEIFTVTCTDGNCNVGSGGSFTGSGYFTTGGGTDFSSVADGAWENCATWGTCPGTTAGVDYPDRYDNATINNNVTVNNVGDNGFGGVSVNNLNQANAGAFSGSGNNRFFQVGNITVSTTGNLNITVTAMTSGITLVNGNGTFDAGNDYANLGYLETGSTSTFSVGDDFALTGFSETVLNNSATSSDDVYLDHTDALLCGSGDLTVNDAVQELNGADTDTQICSGFTVTCTDGNCGLGTGGSVMGGGGFVLPIELLSFTARNIQNMVLLSWVTAVEINNDFFTILRSSDGEDWEQIAEIPGAGNSDSVRSYSVYDFSPLPVSYYQLKQTDFDGKFELFQVIRNEQPTNPNQPLVIYPNPADGFINVRGGFEENVQIFNLAGNNVSKLVIIDQINDVLQINIQNLSQGLYFVRSHSRAVRFYKK